MTAEANRCPRCLRSAAAGANFSTPAAFAVALALLPSLAPADQMQSLEAIQHAARAFALAHFASAGEARKLEIEPERLDPRLRLPACARPLEAFLAPGTRFAARVTVGVRCPGETGWGVVYVPLRVQAYGDVLATRRALARGEILTAHDVVVEQRDLLALPGAPLTGLSRAVGQTLRFPVAAGTVLQPAMLEAPKFVRRGDTVTILVELGSLEVRASGVALTDGAPGDRIRVRNTSTKKVIQATVTAAGLVRIEHEGTQALKF